MRFSLPLAGAPFSFWFFKRFSGGERLESCYMNVYATYFKDFFLRMKFSGFVAAVTGFYMGVVWCFAHSIRLGERREIARVGKSVVACPGFEFEEEVVSKGFELYHATTHVFKKRIYVFPPESNNVGWDKDEEQWAPDPAAFFSGRDAIELSAQVAIAQAMGSPISPGKIYFHSYIVDKDIAVMHVCDTAAFFGCLLSLDGPTAKTWKADAAKEMQEVDPAFAQLSPVDMYNRYWDHFDEPSTQWQLDAVQAQMFLEESSHGKAFESYKGYTRMQQHMQEYILGDVIVEEGTMHRTNAYICCDDPPACTKGISKILGDGDIDNNFLQKHCQPKVEAVPPGRRPPPPAYGSACGKGGGRKRPPPPAYGSAAASTIAI